MQRPWATGLLIVLAAGLANAQAPPGRGGLVGPSARGGRSRTLVFRAKGGSPLTVIPAPDARFDNEMRGRFSGFLGLEDYEQLRPWLVVLRNDTGRSVVAYHVDWQVRYPGIDGAAPLDDTLSAEMLTTPLEQRHPGGILAVDRAIYPGRDRAAIPYEDMGPGDTFTFVHFSRLPGMRQLAKAAPLSAAVDCVVWDNGSVNGACRSGLAQRYFVARAADHDEGLTVLHEIQAGLPPMQVRAWMWRRMHAIPPSAEPTVAEYVNGRAQAAGELNEILRRGGIARLRQAAAALVQQVPPHRALSQLGFHSSRTKLSVHLPGRPFQAL